MDRRTVKNFIMKRSSIWTMSLCLTGALTFGGIAWLDHAIRGEEKTQIKNEEEQELNKFADISDDSEYIAGMDLNFEEYNTTAASGTAIDEANDTNMVNGKLMLEEHSDMDEIQEGMTENPVDENMNESSYNDEMLIDGISENTSEEMHGNPEEELPIEELPSKEDLDVEQEETPDECASDISDDLQESDSFHDAV